MNPPLRYHGGLAGAMAPFALFLTGVTWLGLSGAPDERGFWPVQLAALILGLILAHDRNAYCQILIRGMSQSIVMMMIMAWLLAAVLGTLMNATGFVQALVWLARQAGVSGGGFVGAAFLICCLVSTSTGTSIGTILLCGPLLYPAGGALAAHPAVLMGAIIGGATFGDSISPISDTTIASALTQEADIGGVVRSRLKYVLPAAACALVLYASFGGARPISSAGAAPIAGAALTEGNPRGLPMLAVPALVIGLLLARRHLLEGLLFGILAGAGLGLALGLLQPSQLLRIDAATFSAKGIVVDGIERGIGITVFTLFLIGLVSALEASGTLARLVDLARRRTSTARGAELWIFGMVSAAALLTTHSVVAILTVGQFTRETGARFQLTSYRRANLLDTTVCTFPFILPYFIPVILAASTSSSGGAFGMPRLSPFSSGLANFHSWMQLLVVVGAILTGYGRSFFGDGGQGVAQAAADNHRLSSPG